MTLSDSRLIQLLRTFTQKEWKSFGQFVGQKSGENSTDYKLWKHLNTLFPRFSEEELTKESALKSVFGKTEKDERKLRRLMSVMMDEVQVFLMQLQVEENPATSNLLVLKQFAKRGLDKHHHSLAQKLRKQIDELPKNLDWHYLDFELEMEVQNFSERNFGRVEENRVQGLSDKLDVHFLVMKLKQACSVFSRQRLFNQEFDLGLLDLILQYLEGHPPEEPLVRLYHRCTLMIKHEESPLHYSEFINLLRAEQDHVTFGELQDLHVLAQNHCIRAINTGNRQYRQELFNLYKLGLEQGVVQSDPTHFAPAFKNIVSVAMKLKEYDWAENFVNENASKLGPRYEQDYLRYNLAVLNFAQGKFLECRKLLHSESFTDMFIKLNVRILLIKTYYELEQLDLLESSVESFKQFLHRNKKLSYHKKNCMNLILILKKVVALGPDNQSRADKLSRKIMETKNLAERPWLLEKLAERK